MGTKMEPTYATLTFAYLEEKLSKMIGRKYNNNIKTEFIKSWKRYLDDCFIFWNVYGATLRIYITYFKTYTLK